MSTLITVTGLDGGKVQIEGESVYRVTHAMAADSATAHTRVDFEGGLQETDEPVDRLVGDLQAAGVRMIRLKAPSGAPVCLNPTAITAVMSAQIDVDAPGAQAAVTVAGHRQAVAETASQVEAML